MGLRSFGIVTVAAAGTPVSLADNLTLQTGQPVPLQSVMVQAHPDNTGKIYVFCSMSSPPADHRTDGEGLIAVLPAPGDATTGPFPSGSWGSPAVPNSINLANMWVDAESSADKVIVSGLVG